ncbi:MAG: zf-HC2 domain-containing protein [Pyrinomonadaceae bacterium]
MELEFDKEIDAILRRARSGTTVAADGEHLDADVISAFADGALPERSKPLYTRHLADCDRCRKMLVQAITMNTAAVSAADEAASSVSQVAETSPWVFNLFRTPNLALAMGALVLTFSGVLGYLVLRNQQSETAMVSQSDTEMQKGGPSAGIEANEQIANSNAASTAANTSANAAATNASTASANSAVAGAPADSVTDRSIDSLPMTRRDADKPAMMDGIVTEPKPAPAAPPVDQPAAERDREKLKSDDKEAKDENVLLGGARQETEDRRASGNVATAKKKDAGPTRSGPVQSQSQINTQTSEMPVTRTAGGKKFTNRSGAWYDTAYRGQATTNVRRGTDAYKNLDSGLRSIAETLGGTVVVVWKDKAYRIQ